MNKELQKFYDERKQSLKEIREDNELKNKSLDWMLHADKYKYSYNFSWMGRPIIKYPNDMVVQQELIWKIKPDLIIETGIAHGGSIIFSASMLRMMQIEGEVVAVDIDIRDHNRKLIEDHPMYRNITMYEGDSTDRNIFLKVKSHCEGKKNVMLILDSNHTHEHVLNELNLYSGLVSLGSYIILPDTFIEFFPEGYSSVNRPWDKGNNPYTAMKSFLSSNKNFVIDEEISGKACITETIDGYLKRVK
ncbi:cephalosporin hydroxylase [bacterium]|nr:cephalosporin hydroxylase [bacterium]|tara:strand:- start:4750 stop:5490 length:741 start_codon:yes stop_codon:yes gene_type:complete